MPTKIIPAKQDTLKRVMEKLSIGLARDEGMFAAEIAEHAQTTRRAVAGVLAEVGLPVIVARNPESGRNARMLVHPKTAAAYAKENP